MKNALLLILQSNSHLSTKDIAEMVDRTPECVLKHLRVLLQENKVGMVRGLHNTHVWYATVQNKEAPIPIITQRTLHRRQIVSLFNPVEIAN